VSSATNAATATLPTGPIGELLYLLSGSYGDPLGTFLNSQLVTVSHQPGTPNPSIITSAVTSGLADINSLGPGGLAAPGGEGVTSMIKPLTPAPVSVPSVGVSVNTGGSTLVGKLSVPPTWSAAAQVANHQRVTYAGGGWTNVGRPDRRRYRSRPGRHARYARCGRRQVLAGSVMAPVPENRLTVMGRPLSGG